jgi:hypothetical protein
VLPCPTTATLRMESVDVLINFLLKSERDSG